MEHARIFSCIPSAWTSKGESMERSCADCPEKITAAISRRKNATSLVAGPVLAGVAFQS
jgi:hypothetical protein